MASSIVSANGYAFTLSQASDGGTITLVAAKNDHESKETIVFHLSARAATALSNAILVQSRNAKERRKAVRRAKWEADLKATPTTPSGAQA